MTHDHPSESARKRKPKSSWQFPPEVEAVLRASTNLRPCKRKYGRLPYDKFLEHIRNERCAQCRAFLLQLDKSSG